MTMSSPNWSTIRTTLADDLKSGLSYRQVARKHSVSHQAIAELAEKIGVKSDGAKRYDNAKALRGRAVMKQARPQLRQWYKQGRSIRSIAKDLGVHMEVVRRIVNEMGLA
jgi:hypothetical protein